MGGMWRLPLVLAVMAVGVVVAAGCSKSANTEGTTAATPSSEETAPRPSRPSRPEIACHLHSCAPPSYCNRDKGICERLPCVESRDCPYGYKCDFSKNVCE
jgi:hypothetical protein